MPQAPIDASDSLRLDSIKRVNMIKDSLKLVRQKQDMAEAERMKEAQKKKEAEEKEKKKQPQNDPAIRVEPEELIKQDKKEKDKEDDKKGEREGKE